MTTQQKAANNANKVGERFVGDQLLTKWELAPRLKRSHRTISMWMRQGKLPYFKVGKSVLFRWSDVVEGLAKYRVN
jgi:excisionase family DNA binding protein